MSKSLSRAELAAMDRDELVDLIIQLSETVDDLQARVEDVEELSSKAARERAQLGQRLTKKTDELEADLKDRSDTLHRERSKLARRVAALEDEIGITTQDVLATAKAGEDAEHLSKLGRLVRHGPEAVSDRPTERMYRARDLVENWNRWGTIRDDAHGRERRLASTGHNLKTHLEDARDESLSWNQVYRAMELIDEWSDDRIDLRDGGDEGRYVLVHTPRGDEE